MPTQEEIDNYNSIKADGTLSKLPIATQLKIADRFNDRLTVKTDSFEVPGSGGVVKETLKTLRAPSERQEGFLVKDQKPGLFNLFGLIEDREDLSQPIISTRTITPDVRSVTNKRTGAVTQETGSHPFLESLGETVNENITAMARASGIPFLLEKSGAVENFNKEFGLTDKEYEDIPALQKLGASIPADIATGEVLGGAVKLISKIPIGSKTLGHVVKGNVPHVTEAGRKMLKFRQRQGQIATETLDQFVEKAGGITDDIAKKALQEGFPLDGGNVKSLRKALKVNDASQAAGQKGMKRRLGMTDTEMKDIIERKFLGDRKFAKVPVNTISSDAIKQTVNDTAEEILRKHNTGTPKMFDFKVPDPSELTGGVPTKKYSGNLNLWQVDADDNTKGFLQQVIETNPDLQMRGRILGDQPFSKNLAIRAGEELGLTLDDAATRKMGQLWNNVEVEAYAGQIKKLADDTQALIYKIDTNDEAQTLAGVKSLMNLSAHASNFAGGKSEIGRALNAAKQTSIKDMLNEKTLKGMFNTVKTPEDWKKVLEYIKQLEPGDYKGLNAFLDGLQKTTFEKIGDGLHFVWINSKLSAPMTHVKNTIGNTTAALAGPLEKSLAGVSQTGRALFSKDMQRTRFIGEGPQHAVGLAMGIKDASRSFLHTMKTGLSEFAGEKYSTGFINPVGGKIGTLIELPAGRLLKASDEFFKVLNKRGSLYSLAYRQAAKEKLRGEAFKSRMAELIANPTKELINKAQDEAVYRTFTKDLGKTGKSFQHLLHNTPGLKYIVPFFKTPVNVTKYGVERTPLGFLQLLKSENRLGGRVDDIISKAYLGTATTFGGAGLGLKAVYDIGAGNVNRPASQPNAQSLSMASLLTGGIAQAFAEGSITGGAPIDPDERKVFYASGKKPYAVLVGDTWYSYAVEPLGTSLGLIADSLQLWDKISNEDAAAGISIAVARNFTNKSFMQGLSNLFDAWGDPERHGQRLVNGIASGFVPFSSLGKAINNSLDPTLRNPENIGDAVSAVIPGMTSKIPPIYDIWGKKVTSDSGPIESLFNPIRHSEKSTDKATQEVERLNVQPGSIHKSVGNIELEGPIYHMAQQFRGIYAKQMIDAKVNEPNWERRPDIEKAEILTKMFVEAGTKARAQLLVTSNNKETKNLVRAIEFARQRGETGSEKELRSRLQNVLDRDIVKLKGKQP